MGLTTSASDTGVRAILIPVIQPLNIHRGWWNAFRKPNFTRPSAICDLLLAFSREGRCAAFTYRLQTLCFSSSVWNLYRSWMTCLEPPSNHIHSIRCGGASCIMAPPPVRGYAYRYQCSLVSLPALRIFTIDGAPAASRFFDLVFFLFHIITIFTSS